MLAVERYGNNPLGALQALQSMFGNLTPVMLRAVNSFFARGNPDSEARINPQAWWGGEYGPPGAFRGQGRISDAVAAQHKMARYGQRMSDLRERFSPGMDRDVIGESYRNDVLARLAEMSPASLQGPQMPTGWWAAPHQPYKSSEYQTAGY